MKFNLNKVINNNDWLNVEGNYDSLIDDYKEGESVKYKIQPISFEMIPKEKLSKTNEVNIIYQTGAIYLLTASVVNLSKKKFSTTLIEESLCLKIGNFEYASDFFDLFNNIEYYNIADAFNEYLIKINLRYLTNLDKFGGFIPGLTINGGIPFILPNDSKGSNFISIRNVEYSFENGKLYIDGEFENKAEANYINGWIYVLYNPSMPNDMFKIGMTTRTPKQRVKELSDKTGVPTPFEILFQHEVCDPAKVEKIIHNELDKYRYQPNREFFQINSEFLLPKLNNICSRFPKKMEPTPDEIEKLRKLNKISEVEDRIKHLHEELTELKKNL